MLSLIILTDLFQAIASMVRARDADPANLEVLLALGVSHTNGISALRTTPYAHYVELGCLPFLWSSMDSDLIW